MSDTIKSIIQINGGKSVPATLESRELFIGADGYLRYGDMDANGADVSGAEVSDLKVKTADKSSILQNSDYSYNGKYIDIPRLTYRFLNNVAQLTLEGNSKISLDGLGTITRTTISGFSTIGTKGLSTKPTYVMGDVGDFSKLSKVIVDSVNYGSTEPTDEGSEGQLYFQILGD